MNLPNGTEMLLAALRYGDEPDRARRLGSVTAEDWPDILRLAHQHSVTAILRHRLKALGTPVPAGVMQQLRAGAANVAARNLRLFHQLGAVLSSLHQDGIPVIPLKGAYLAEVVYRNISLRPMCDVDLLVNKQDLGRVQDVMMTLGFARSNPFQDTGEDYQHLRFKHPQNGCFEVHWELIARSSGLTVDIGALWQRSSEARVAGVPVRAMAPEDQLLHLCLHASNHNFAFGLRALCDIGETLRYHEQTLDWQRLSQRASDWGAARILLANLWLAKELLQAPHSNILTGIRAERSLKGKWSLVLKGLGLLSRRKVAEKYPAPPDSPRILVHYPAYLAHLILRLVRENWRLAFPDGGVVSRLTYWDHARGLREWLWTRD